MNDDETRVYENHAQDARVREVGEGGGLPVYRTDRRELSVDERQQPAPARAAGGCAMRDGAVGVGIYNAQVTGVPDFRIDAERIGGEQQPAGRRNLAVRGGVGRGVWWDGAECASTVTTRSLGQYMPDKDNFGAVIAYVQ